MALDAVFAAQLWTAAGRLVELLENFGRSRILVVGDLTLDEFMTGQVERVSREAPVLILRHQETKQVPGGGANAIYNLAKLGAQVKAVGLVGQDSQGEALRQIFSDANIDIQGVLIDPDRPTVTKTRISGHARQSVTQQIVRIDRKSDDSPHPGLQAQLATYIAQQLDQVDAVICSDYGDQTLMPPVIAAALAHRRSIVDAQQGLARYRGATLFTPNLPEAEQAVGYPLTSSISGQTRLGILNQAGHDLLALTHAKQVVITRGEEGMSLFDISGAVHHLPAFNQTKVFDVTGAGDTVVAALTLGLTLGASLWEASVLGNLAASIVVRQFGTTTTSVDEMRAALRGLLEEARQA